MSRAPVFTPETFRFLSDLAANNDRTWFGLNRTRYESSVRDPALAFIEEVGYGLREQVSRHLTASSRSLFRIHRDTRFSRDKTPYKTHAAMHFPHSGSAVAGRPVDPAVREDVHRPGCYLHLEPGKSFMGCGIWQPPTEVLHRIREAIVAHETDWAAFRATGIDLQGERLKRVPPGFPKAHRFADDLARKDFIVSRSFTDAEICARGFADAYVGACRELAPLMRFLCKALALPW